MITSIQQINSELPVDLFEAKQHLMIDHSLDDAYIASLIQAAVSIAENITNRKLTLHQVEMLFDRLSNTLHLPFGNVNNLNITSTNGILRSPSYIVGIDKVVFQKEEFNVQLSFNCGYTPKTCPSDIKIALLLLVATLYESRLDVTFGVQQFKAHLSSTTILNKYRMY